MVSQALHKKGFTLLELIIVFAIIALLSAILIGALVSTNTSQALDKDTQTTVTVLEEARSKTLASADASRYGVHVASSSLTVFKGSAYNSADLNNQVIFLNPLTIISTVSVTGGG